MLRPFLLGVALASTALGAVATAPYAPTPPWSDALAVRTVSVAGTERARPVEVRHLADVHAGTPVWSVSAAAVAEAVERHPWVRSAEVDVVWPDRVEIRVEERKIAGVILDGERWLYVDDLGAAFLAADDLDFPVLSGMGRELDRLHPDLGRLARARAAALLARLGREDTVAAEQISEVAFAPNVGFVVHTRGATLLFGLEGFERQVRRLGQLLAMDVDLDQRLTIDLAPEEVALVRPSAGRYPLVANDFRPPLGTGTLALVGRAAHDTPRIPR